jgi:N-acetylglucosaminyldiphosphoundecaprenol N-acetyl-beta-D-mannosaminyltransferase
MSSGGHAGIPIRVVNILSIGVSAVNMDVAVSTIASWIQRSERRYVCITGVQGVMESHVDPNLRRIHNEAGLVTPDGMPLVVLGRLMGHRHMNRVYGPDLMLEMFGRSAFSGYSHFLYGATEATLSRLRQNLTARFPGARIAGAYAPPFRPLNNTERVHIIEDINRSSADIVWVGLSTPKQEYWMAEMRPHLVAPVLIGVGAAFDFHAGNARQAPRWMQRACLEWFFRLLMEPRRLWRRYLYNNPRFLYLITMQLLGLKRFD